MTYSTQENYKSPVLQYDEATNLYRLDEDYTQEWGPVGFRKRLFMAAGYEYDKASVPRPLWGVARPDGPWDGPSLWHDRFWQEKGKFPHPELFRFETQNSKGEWNPDLSPWHTPATNSFLSLDAQFAGIARVEAEKYKWAVILFPLNWFKRF